MRDSNAEIAWLAYDKMKYTAKEDQSGTNRRTSLRTDQDRAGVDPEGGVHSRNGGSFLCTHFGIVAEVANLSVCCLVVYGGFGLLANSAHGPDRRLRVLALGCLTAQHDAI